MPDEVRPCLDDPWEFLARQREVLTAVVGRVDECPDKVTVAWIRRVVPDEADINRSRWPTDPVWRVVQAAPFADVPLALRQRVRRPQRGEAVRVLDRGQYGYLASGLPNNTTLYGTPPPLGYDHINLLGRYTFALADEIRQGAFHPLRELEETEPAEQEAGSAESRRGCGAERC